MKKKLPEILIDVFKNLVLGLFGLCVGFLMLQSMYTTVYSFVAEDWYVKDRPLKAIAVFILIIALVVTVERILPVIETFIEKNIRKEIQIKHLDALKDISISGRYSTNTIISFLTFLILGFVLLWFVAATQVMPYGDQQMLCIGAEGLENYDFSVFTKGNYFDYWPFQSRVTVFLWGFFKIFGFNNYLAFQLLNIFAIIISVYFIGKIWALCCDSHGYMAVVTQIACALFVPLLLYVVFIYGNLPGLAFILGAVYALMLYRRTHSWKFLIPMVLCTAIAIGLKSNYLIIEIAIIVFLTLDVWENFWFNKETGKRRAAVSLISVVAILAAVSFTNSVLDGIVEKRLGFELSDGTPMTAWVAMALSEDEKGNPVQYNAYNLNVYVENDCDSQKAALQIEKDLADNIVKITDTPSHFMSFMAKKIAVIWCEPTFQGMVAVNHCTPRTAIPEGLRLQLREDNRSLILKYCNLFETVMLMSAFAWVLLCFRKIKLDELFFPVVFIGGFLFQMFWESQSQYALTYMLLLIPMAMSGIRACANLAQIHITKTSLGVHTWKRMVLPLAFMLLLICYVGVSKRPIIDNLFRIDMDNEAYTVHMMEKLSKEEAEAPCLDKGIYKMINVGTGDTIEVTVFHDYGYDMIRYYEDGLLMSLDMRPIDGDASVIKDGDYYLWNIRENGDGYTVEYDGYALEADDDGLMIVTKDGNENQKWYFERQ